MKKTYISWLVFGLSAALVAACGSNEPAPKKAAVIPVPNLGLVPMPRDISGATGTFRLAADTDVVYSGGEGAASRRSVFRRARNPAEARRAFAAPRRARPDPVTSPSCWPASGMRRRRIWRRRLFARHRTRSASPSRRAPQRDSSMARSRCGRSSPRSRCRACPSTCPRSGSPTRRVSPGAVSCSIPRATTSRRSTSSSSSTGWRCTSSTSCTGISPTTRRGASR